MNLSFLERLSEFAHKDLVVCDQFLSDDSFKHILTQLPLYKTNLSPARVGAKSHFTRKEEIRGDFVSWFDPNCPPQELEIFFKHLNQIQQKLNQDFFLGLKDLECHLAFYPMGAFYRRHLDKHQEGSTRALTYIYYLNPDWREGDGGELKIYEEDQVQLIEPKGNRFVLFLSDKILHEVLPTHKERWSITGWFHQ